MGELAAFDAELRALESSSGEGYTAAAPRIIAAVPKVIEAKPVLGKAALPPAVTASGRTLPVSEWKSPEELRAQLAAEGMPVPLLPPSLPPAMAGGSGSSAAPSTLSVQQDSEPYIASASFAGPKTGYVFKNGPKGLGYYLEGTGVSLATSGLPAPVSAPRAAGGSHSVGGGGGGSTSAAPSGDRNISRTVAGQVWQDKTLLEWPEDDFRVFVGDLGNEVNDDVLHAAFTRYPSFQMARVVRDKHSNKTKGYGFVSFKDPWDMTKALREMQGKYVGNRPIKIRKSTYADRQVTETHKPLQFEHALGVADKSTQRALKKGGAIHKKPSWKDQKKKKGMPW